MSPSQLRILHAFVAIADSRSIPPSISDVARLDGRSITTIANGLRNLERTGHVVAVLPRNARHRLVLTVKGREEFNNTT